MKHLKTIAIISLLILLTGLFSKCMHTSPTDPRGQQYAGSAACISCHKNISASYTHNGHYNTSAEADPIQLKKHIDPLHHRFYFADSTYIRMTEEDQLLFQSYFTDSNKTASAKFDIAFGSGEKAQTYAYWKDHQLYQLPLTWFAALDGWANSPGFSAAHARYDRVITSRCFECHASWIDKEVIRSGPLSVSENLDKNSIIYGIDCERCHGPALEHAAFQRDNPTVRTARYITPIRSLTRQQQLDVCAVCHSGNDQTTQRSMFSFTPGDTLSHFYYPDFGAGGGEPDVHGKQLQLLRSSKCFKASSMTCTTCHDPHTSEKDQTALFIAKCMDCHRNSVHAIAVIKGNEQNKRDFNLVGPTCIDCHMPLQISKTIHSTEWTKGPLSEGQKSDRWHNWDTLSKRPIVPNPGGGDQKNIPYLLRTHRIALYK